MRRRNPASSRSFTPKGTPASGPGSSPRATFSSTASAAARARSGSSTTNAFSSSLRALIASRHSSRTSTAFSSPARTASAISITVLTMRTLRRRRPASSCRRIRRPRLDQVGGPGERCAWAAGNPQGHSRPAGGPSDAIAARPARTRIGIAVAVRDRTSSALERARESGGIGSPGLGQRVLAPRLGVCHPSSGKVATRCYDKPLDPRWQARGSSCAAGVRTEQCIGYSCRSPAPRDRRV